MKRSVFVLLIAMGLFAASGPASAQTVMWKCELNGDMCGQTISAPNTTTGITFEDSGVPAPVFVDASTTPCGTPPGGSAQVLEFSTNASGTGRSFFRIAKDKFATSGWTTNNGNFYNDHEFWFAGYMCIPENTYQAILPNGAQIKIFLNRVASTTANSCGATTSGFQMVGIGYTFNPDGSLRSVLDDPCVTEPGKTTDAATCTAQNGNSSCQGSSGGPIPRGTWFSVVIMRERNPASHTGKSYIKFYSTVDDATGVLMNDNHDVIAMGWDNDTTGTTDDATAALGLSYTQGLTISGQTPPFKMWFSHVMFSQDIDPRLTGAFSDGAPVPGAPYRFPSVRAATICWSANHPCPDDATGAWGGPKLDFSLESDLSVFAAQKAVNPALKGVIYALPFYTVSENGGATNNGRDSYWQDLNDYFTAHPAINPEDWFLHTSIGFTGTGKSCLTPAKTKDCRFEFNTFSTAAADVNQFLNLSNPDVRAWLAAKFADITTADGCTTANCNGWYFDTMDESSAFYAWVTKDTAATVPPTPHHNYKYGYDINNGTLEYGVGSTARVNYDADMVTTMQAIKAAAPADMWFVTNTTFYNAPGTQIGDTQRAIVNALGTMEPEGTPISIFAKYTILDAVDAWIGTDGNNLVWRLKGVWSDHQTRDCPYPAPSCTLDGQWSGTGGLGTFDNGNYAGMTGCPDDSPKICRYQLSSLAWFYMGQPNRTLGMSYIFLGAGTDEDLTMPWAVLAKDMGTPVDAARVPFNPATGASCLLTNLTACKFTDGAGQTNQLVFRRQFQHGYVISRPVSTDAGLNFAVGTSSSITLPAGSWCRVNYDGTCANIGSLSLANGEGVLLMAGSGEDVTPPTVNVTAPTEGATLSGTRDVTATASDDVGVVGVQFKLDGSNLGSEDLTAPYSYSWNTVLAAPGSHTLTAVARDAAGNSTTSAAITVTVTDQTAPTVSLTAPPASPPNLTGSVDVTATAADDVGVVGVQFKLDGSNLGAEDTAAPYSYSWDTTGVANGSHTLTAVARDAAGNSTTSTGVLVNVLNVTKPVIHSTYSLTPR